MSTPRHPAPRSSGTPSRHTACFSMPAMLLRSCRLREGRHRGHRTRTAVSVKMPARRIKGNSLPLLSPFPEGWYFVASRQSILKAKLIQKTWLGEDIVAWCDGAGRVCVAVAVCPHLGSDLEPAAGGRVRDGCLVCPFHGFEFDVSGQCVATRFSGTADRRAAGHPEARSRGAGPRRNPELMVSISTRPEITDTAASDEHVGWPGNRGTRAHLSRASDGHARG